MGKVTIEHRGSQQDRADLARLIRGLPLKTVLNITGSMLADRKDLDGRLMQEFQRKINDLTWPLVTVDQDDRVRVRNSV